MIINQSQLRFRYIFFVLLLLTSGLLTAQTEFWPGYIITNTTDTIYGEIALRTDKLMSDRCSFRNTNSETKVFTPEDIAGYRFLNGRYFVSRLIDGKKEFLEYLINGQMSIYYKSDLTGSHYFLEKKGDKIVEMPYKEEYVYRNGNEYLKKSKNHIGLLVFYMQDAPDMQNSIYKIDKPGHSNLIKLAEDYHNKVCNEPECIIYEKKVRSVKFEIEVQAGINKLARKGFIYQDFFLENDIVHSRSAGLILHISSPMISDKYMLKTGFHYSNYIDSRNINKMGVVSFPLGIEYLRSRGIIRPGYSIGLNLVPITRHNFFEFSLGGGLNFKITDSMLLGLNYSIDVLPGFIFGEKFLQTNRQSILAGIRLKL